jgi:quinol monooxygenase YgiN
MTDTAVTVVARIKVRPGTDSAALQLLGSIVSPTRDEPGCLAYDLHQSAADPTEFMFYERWSSDDALAAHSASTAPHRVALREQLGAIIDGPPSVTRWRRAG